MESKTKKILVAVIALSLIGGAGAVSLLIPPVNPGWEEIVSLSFTNATGTRIFAREHMFHLPSEFYIEWNATDTIGVGLRFESDGSTYWGWSAQNASQTVQVGMVDEGKIVFPAIYIGDAVDGVSFDLRIEAPRG